VGLLSDVVIKRWQWFTGKLATVDGDGRSFDNVAAKRRPNQPVAAGASCAA
jgi:hypothetical protein